MKPKIAAALAIAGVLAGYQGGWAVAMQAQANASGSEVADSSAILVIDVLAVNFSPWQPDTDGSGLKSREARLQLRLREVLKGRVQQPAGQPFDLTVRQRGTGGTRVMDYYGIWSHAPLAPGASLIAFCGGESDDIRVLLDEQNCDELMQADKVYNDTRAATLLEARKLPAAEVLPLAARVASQYGALFARLVWVLVRTEVIQNPFSFDQMMRIVENPATNQGTRETYLTRAHEELGLRKSVPREHEIRLAQAMFRVLDLKESGSDLKQGIAEVYLPNLLGLSQGKAKYTTGDVLTSGFHRTGLADSVRRTSQDPRAQALAAWIQAEARK